MPTPRRRNSATPPAGALKLGGVGVPGSLYERTLETSRNDWERFNLSDCAGRVLRVLVTFYVLMFTHPISFGYFLVRYNMLWEGPVVGLLVTLIYPFWPFLALVQMILKKAFVPTLAYEAGNVFFMAPDNPVSALLWNYYKMLSPPLAQFMLNRGNSQAFAHSWFDHETHKCCGWLK